VRRKYGFTRTSSTIMRGVSSGPSNQEECTFSKESPRGVTGCKGTVVVDKDEAGEVQ